MCRFLATLGGGLHTFGCLFLCRSFLVTLNPFRPNWSSSDKSIFDIYSKSVISSAVEYRHQTALQGLQLKNKRSGSALRSAHQEFLMYLSNYSRAGMDSHFTLTFRIIGSKRFPPRRRSRKCQSALAYSFIECQSCPWPLPPRPPLAVHRDTSFKGGYHKDYE